MRARGTIALYCLAGLLASRLAAQAAPARQRTATITGTLTDSVTGAPIRIAVVRDVEAEVSTLTDDAGRFRMDVPVGTRHLQIRRIGYSPASVTVTVPNEGVTVDVALHPVPFRLAAVVVSSDDDAARRIIAAAVARKQQLRNDVHDYRYDAAVRFVVRDLAKPADSASSILVIAETRTSAYWERPNRYQETILARRQTGNLDAERNLIAVGEIVNFSRDRVQLRQYELVSPIADDALSHYDYRILDTLAIGGRRVFRLSLEPKADGLPAFSGFIDVVDSTFDVAAVDVGVNSAVRLGLFRNVRYQQRYSDVGGGRWMPYSIELTGDLQLRIPFPGVPSRLSIRHVAELTAFQFDQGRRPAGLGEYRIVVADSADRADSATWTNAAAMPRTPAEQAAWIRIDSIAHAPPDLRRRAIQAGVALAAVTRNPDVFHFNRVDGAYFGVGGTLQDPPGMPHTTPTAKIGRATASDLWQYRLGDRLEFSESQRLSVGATYHDETVSRPTFTSPGYNSTTRALFTRIDPLDYYRERGIVAVLTTKLVDLTRLDISYTDARQSSLPLAVTKPLFGGNGRDNTRPIRPNDPIADGLMRSVAAGITFDSRPILHRRGEDTRLGAAQWTRVTVDAEVSSPSLLASDFDYRRYTVRLEHRRNSFGMGVTTVMATAGLGTSGLPPQRYFTIDGGARVLETQASPFSTLTDSNFTGSRAAAIALDHDFDRLLFIRSNIPLVREIPYTLSVRAAIFWSDLAPSAQAVGGVGSFPATTLNVARRPYEEAGFTVGNLTPFLSPFNFAARFAWQLSAYPTRRFRIGLDLRR